MAQENASLARINPDHLEEVQQAARPPLPIRWWVLPLAVLLCIGQAVLNLLFEAGPPGIYLISTQICVIAFGFLLVLTLVVNPLMRLWWPLALTLALVVAQFVVVCGFAAALQYSPAFLYAQIAVFILAAAVMARMLVGGTDPQRWQAAILAAAALMLPGLLLLLLHRMGADAFQTVAWVLGAAADGRIIAITRGQVALAGHIFFLTATVAAAALALRKWWKSPRALYIALALFVVAMAIAAVMAWKNLPAQVLLLASGAYLGFLLFAVLRALFLNGDHSFRPLVRPFNRGEVMALFAAMFVSAGISSFGLVDQLVPLIATPFNAQWNVPQRKWDVTVIPNLKPDLYITDSAKIAEFREGFGTSQSAWTIVKKVPWMLWARPLALWMVFVGAMYLMFYSLSMLLYDTWARREKLVFPLARMPEGVIAEDGAEPGAISSTYKSGLFWIGFIAVMVLLGYNGACQAGWLRGLTPLRYGLEQNQLITMLSDSVFKGIAENAQFGLSFTLIFTAIGIGFLLPLEISRSLWMYYLLGIGLFLVAIWTAVGSSMKSFPSDWLTENNFVSSLGAGGLLAFSAAYVGKVLAERVSDSLSGDGPAHGAWRLVRWDGLLFILSVAVAAGWLTWSGIPLHWAGAFLAIVILMTIGLMRVVAEGGVYWFQIHVGPFHLAKMFGLAKLSSGAQTIGSAVLGPLMPVYSVLFLDIKTFMAPAVINSFKMQEETRAARRRFHATVVLSVVATVAAATIAILYMTYRVGANRASSWFFTGGPGWVMDSAQKLASGVIGRADNDVSWIFYLLGAAWVILSILMRRRFFWWLHPIGFVMMANPLMRQMWFSFFLGWLCKGIVVKYGGRHMFTRISPLFFGIIFGELAGCLLWSVLAYTLGLEQVRMDLNRYYP